LEKMQSGKILVNAKTTDVDEMLLAAQANSAAFARAGVEVRVTSCGLIVDADQHRVVQALTALLKVLVEKFSQDSVVRISAERYKQGVNIAITVPFWPTDDQSTEQTGDIARERLAINLSRLIAEQHGGTLAITRTASGRLISIYLPGGQRE
jgi:K+-sensing histidine kinase KdpD